MLCEREALYGGDDWILNEAMDIHNLQTGGTFMNALIRKLDDVVTPCLAQIIAFVDRSCNLSLLQLNQTPLSQFWLRIFASKRVMEALKFTDIVESQRVQMMNEVFACKFPFWWLVKELMDSQWDNAWSIAGMPFITLQAVKVTEVFHVVYLFCSFFYMFAFKRSFTHEYI